MKIIFVYFDFEYGGKHPEGYRGFHQCELNFSTNYTYSLMREENICRINRIPLPENQKIEPGFWTDPRIYNITAIVGDNGSGKTTLLHALLRACLMNSEVDFGFVVLLEHENSEENNNLRLYTNMNYEFKATNINVEQTQDYPQELMKTKFMLLDNTITLSSIELVNEYEKEYIECQRSNYGYYQMPIPKEKPTKQFFNESLISSLCYSNYISTRGTSVYMNDITEQIATHFRYETYQEFRYVFDKHQRNTLLELKKDGYNVPIPKHLTISIYPPNFNYYKHRIECHNNNSQNTMDLFDKDYPRLYIDALERIDFENCSDIIHSLGINCLINYLFIISHHHPPLRLVEELTDFNSFSKEVYVNFINQCPVKISESAAEKYRKNTITFIEFIMQNKELIYNIFIRRSADTLQK